MSSPRTTNNAVRSNRKWRGGELDAKRDRYRWGRQRCGMAERACGAQAIGRRCHGDRRHPHGRGERLTGVVSRHRNGGDTYGRAVTRSGQSCGTGEGLMARAGFRERSARSAAHPGGVVAGRQRQHDRESCESLHVRLDTNSGKTRASVIMPVFTRLATRTVEFSRTIEKVHAARRVALCGSGAKPKAVLTFIRNADSARCSR